MNREQLKQALIEGKRVTHPSFTPDEYIEGIKGTTKIRTEDGYECTYGEFMTWRDNPAFDTSWEVITTTNVQTVAQRIQKLAQTAGGKDDLLTNQMANEVFPVIKDAINNHKGMGEYKLTWDSPATDYPSQLYVALSYVINPVVYNWLNEHYPQAQFKSIYKSI